MLLYIGYHSIPKENTSQMTLNKGGTAPGVVGKPMKGGGALETL